MGQRTQEALVHESELAKGNSRQIAAFSTDGNRVIRIVVESFNPDEDTDFIVRAVNAHDALVAALERARKLARLVTVRQAIDAGDAAIEAAGLNPWAMNEGLADGSERVDTYFIDAALLLAKHGAASTNEEAA